MPCDAAMVESSGCGSECGSSEERRTGEHETGCDGSTVLGTSGRGRLAGERVGGASSPTSRGQTQQLSSSAAQQLTRGQARGTRLLSSILRGRGSRCGLSQPHASPSAYGTTLSVYGVHSRRYMQVAAWPGRGRTYGLSVCYRLSPCSPSHDTGESGSGGPSHLCSSFCFSSLVPHPTSLPTLHF